MWYSFLDVIAKANLLCTRGLNKKTGSNLFIVQSALERFYCKIKFKSTSSMLNTNRSQGDLGSVDFNLS